ncbi:helix-turn-helix domain-containing protein [Amycolatopsis lurida]|uniref:helix-turn-helix domain-containing protein n=1 Tax=Amycolatopsis sp. YIM 10 TaxID=2653857 RepID=UPI00129035C5|nr:XRE family transcriptional regulator [Amycolatopsis sp. YIM 10]QFU86180.1 HTH-type transcriptional regulator PuuR [Amycolatopsis sp. YIM 10]
MSEIEQVLSGVGPRLKALRRERRMTLGALAEATGIGQSTLSRLESGQRRATLELLLPLARAYQVPLDDLVGAPAVGDPRVRIEAKQANGMTTMALSKRPGQPQAYKLIVPPRYEPEPQVHEGYEWMYVLDGRLRLILGDRDMVLGPGEAAEFDTRVPHWFGAADDYPVELLSLFGKQGERAHLRAKAAPR